MSTAMQVIEKAIREKKGVRIFLSNHKTMDGVIPVCLHFAGNRFRIKETSRHDGNELQLEVDYRHGPIKVAWPCGSPEMKVQIEGIYEVDNLWNHHFAVYAFLFDGAVSCWSDSEIVQVAEEQRRTQKEKPNHIMADW